jgi:hypothetical protein
MPLHRVFAAILLPLLAISCQWLPKADSDHEGDQNGLRPVLAGSITENGSLETKYNLIERGMTEAAVVAILGRQPDQTMYPGGSLGGDWCFWFEDKATIFVDIDFARDFTGLAVVGKTITPTTQKQGPGRWEAKTDANGMPTTISLLFDPISKASQPSSQEK